MSPLFAPALPAPPAHMPFARPHTGTGQASRNAARSAQCRSQTGQATPFVGRRDIKKAICPLGMIQTAAGLTTKKHCVSELEATVRVRQLSVVDVSFSHGGRIPPQLPRRPYRTHVTDQLRSFITWPLSTHERCPHRTALFNPDPG